MVFHQQSCENVTELHQVFFIVWNHGISRPLKFICALSFSLKPRFFNTANIKCFTFVTPYEFGPAPFTVKLQMSFFSLHFYMFVFFSATIFVPQGPQTYFQSFHLLTQIFPELILKTISNRLHLDNLDLLSS